MTTTVAMTSEQQRLYERIRTFQFDEGPAVFPFAARLARDNGWSAGFAARVVTEYRRFVFLAVAVGHPVSPSDQVDQVWHLHLLYTESYWIRLCKGTLGTPLGFLVLMSIAGIGWLAVVCSARRLSTLGRAYLEALQDAAAQLIASNGTQYALAAAVLGMAGLENTPLSALGEEFKRGEKSASGGCGGCGAGGCDGDGGCGGCGGRG